MILAVISFLGSVVVQAWWIRSAYEGELSLYKKEKRQFQQAVEESLKHDHVSKDLFKDLFGDQNKERAKQREKQLLNRAGDIIKKIQQDFSYNIEVKDYGIARHKHNNNEEDHFKPVAFARQETLGSADLNNAGHICLHCLLNETTEKHGESNYELVILYGNENSGIYKKMGILIFASLVFLLCLGFLFKLLLSKYNQERKLTEAKNDFINNLSHEIQTPVFAMQVANKLIKEKTGRQSDLEPLTSVIDKETQQLKQHATKILELASLENEQVELNPEWVEINDFIEGKKPTMELLLKDKGGILKTHYGVGSLSTFIDKTHLNNVLVSLIENSIKYNNGIPEINIETGEKDDFIFIRLEDNGMGIEQQHLPYVFDKFYRVPGRNGAKGFGLGLSYVRQIMNLHKGFAEIKSRLNSGTVVTLFFPKKE